MKRPWGPMLAVFILAGCRTPAQPNDPFLYRSTIPPPGTLTVPGTPGAPQPYYPSTGTPASIPGPAPPLVSPGVVAPPPQPAAVPVSPAVPTYPANQAAPAGPQNNYLPPGGFSFPQSSSPLPTAPPTQPSAAPASGSSPPQSTDTGVISAAAWQQSADRVTTNTPARPEPSVIRIVEPPAKPTAPDAAANVAIVSPGTPVSPPERVATAPIVAAPATAAVATAPPIAVAPSATASNPARVASPPEITDLPVLGSSANSAANHVASTGPVPRSTNYPPLAARGFAASSAVTSKTVNLPGDRPGSSYGYDPGYKNVRGKLEYSVTTRVWRLRYLPAEALTDANGGVAAIADARQLAGFESGDFVAVQGTFSPATVAGSTATLAVERIQRQ